MNKRLKAHRRGHRGEALAAALLMLKGYRILARRWKSPYGEIDLVARRGGELVFVEVKARHTEEEALDAVTVRQRRRIERAAAVFLQTRPDCGGGSCRFDVVAFTPPLNLKHTKDAWRP